ncbi:hypothetical protein [Pseudoalteromonas sp. S2755]|uniref:hypothetical protein n=1 Tax=Pseudoalteromonas sp. S2755 TaxID=2066523 RepID=UPI00110C0C79|nr:hypothetical protein [Pseudoalteromonas sp. S2755]TMN38827.1 hypothetical protein CWC03_10795 [Pseudoalteromonas sp. S2755]
MTQETQEFTPSMNSAEVSAQQMLTNVLSERIQAGALEKAIATQVDNLIEDTAKDVFRSYSEFGKEIKKQFTNAIMPCLKDLDDLPTYHNFVANRLKAAAQKFYDERLSTLLEQELAEITSELPETVTLSWFLERVIKSTDEEYEGEITLIIEEPSWSSGNSFSSLKVYIDKEADKSSSECEYDLHLSKCEETGNYEILGIRISGDNPKNQLSIGRLYNFEKALFNVYAMKGQIVLDKGIYAHDYETSGCDW